MFLYFISTHAHADARVSGCLGEHDLCGHACHCRRISQAAATARCPTPPRPHACSLRRHAPTHTQHHPCPRSRPRRDADTVSGWPYCTPSTTPCTCACARTRDDGGRGRRRARVAHGARRRAGAWHGRHAHCQRVCAARQCHVLRRHALVGAALHKVPAR